MNGTWKEFFKAIGWFLLLVLLMIVLVLALAKLGDLIQELSPGPANGAGGFRSVTRDA